jgi:hypothetical protein
MHNNEAFSPLKHWISIWIALSNHEKHSALLLGLWLLSAIWGWFFVEPTILQNSEAAREIVAVATRWFPWIANVQKLGPQANKALYLHSVFALLSVLPGLLSGIIWERSQLQVAKISALGTMGRVWHLISYPIGVALLLLLYLQLRPSLGAMHRMDYFFFIGEVTMPLISPLLTGGIWAGIGGFLGVVSVHLIQVNRE